MNVLRKPVLTDDTLRSLWFQCGPYRVRLNKLTKKWTCECIGHVRYGIEMCSHIRRCEKWTNTKKQGNGSEA